MAREKIIQVVEWRGALYGLTNIGRLYQLKISTGGVKWVLVAEELPRVGDGED